VETLIARTGTPELREIAIVQAAEFLRKGPPVALPTETVYGLAADATRSEAVLKIFEAKERPFFDPLIVHLPSLDWLARIAKTDQALLKPLVEKFWPGPLTIVLPRREVVPDVVAAGLPTVAIRMSAHPVFQAVIECFGKPLAAPSANRFGRISPTTAEHVFAELNGRIPLIVDGGATSFGVESTIVSILEDRVTILRSGPITSEQFAEFGEVQFAKPNENLPDAPGQLKSHYAPSTPLRLVTDATEFQHSTSRIGLLAWRDRRHGFAAVEILSQNGDLREAAAGLFAAMRRLDEQKLDLIIAEAVPETGLGRAIMERLRKASAR
jgi:L-threonylcarbamoyladenylate synthase